MRGSLLEDYDVGAESVSTGMGRPNYGYDSSGKNTRGSNDEHYQRAGYTDSMAGGDEERFRGEGAGNEFQRSSRRQPDRFSWFVLKLTVTSAIGGFLFGYDTGVVSGAMLLIKDEFSLTDWEEEVVVSVTIAAAVTAAVSGGPAMERWGRRPLILLAAIIFTVGAVVLAAANSYGTLVIGRCVSACLSRT